MRKSLFIGLVAVLGLIGCSRNQEIDIPDANLSIFARTESPADTKTVVESGVHVYWEPGDEIAVFTGDQSAKFTTDITTASGTATFKGTFGDATWPEDLDLWAVYPFSEDAVFDGETITTTLPSEQVAREGSFGKDMNLAIAHSNSSTLQFYNVGGGIRFSVTEEGIKKVMFEGLSGEIISGKVKIGMDENDLPVVKEVTGGSQFITLLPPSGQDTFEPGDWYYIVAIPGTLEGGYKLRFYKDSDYARKVSEKAVEIKRSIFGSQEKADEGIEYEATTMHFPETENEWKESVATSKNLVNRISKILNADNSCEEDILNEILQIEGVLAAKSISSGCTISVIQKDSLCINFIRDAMKKMDDDEDVGIDEVAQQVMLRKTTSSNNSFYHSWDEPYIMNSKKKAIILSPFQHSFEYDLNSIVNALYNSGYSKDNIDVYKDHDATIKDFTGARLSEYDFIFIATHGGLGYGSYPSFEEIEGVSCLCTYVRFTEGSAYAFAQSLKRNEMAVMAIDDDENGEDELYFAMIPDCLGDYKFDDTCVVLDACHSVELADKNDPGSMVWKFLNNGASLVSGFNNTATTLAFESLSNLFSLTSHGFSYQDAADYIKNSPKTKEFCDGWFSFYHNHRKRPLEEKPTFEFYNLFECYENPKSNGKPYYFLYPIPLLEETHPIASQVTLSWNDPLKTFGIGGVYRDVFGTLCNLVETFTIRYDIYIDGHLIDDGYALSAPPYIWESPTPGGHSWSVLARYMQGDQIIDSFQSGIGEFTVDKVGEAIIEILDEDYATYCPVGRNKSASFTIRNNGDAALVISDVYFNDDDMTASFNWTTATINPNESKDLVVTFSPLNTGPHRPSINIYSNASNPNYSYSVRMNYFSFDCYGQHAIPSYSDEMVDLGLSVKWAACDLGTSTILDYGEHYAWGETDRKSRYSWDNYKWCNGSEETITKYTYYEGPFILDSADDAATVHLGEGWRMPTQEECQELIDNCQWRATEKDGVAVFEVTSRKNGNKIYFMRWSSAVGMLSDYWANSLWSDDGAYDFALCWYGYSEDCNPMLCGMGKAYGALIRPVYQGNSGGSSHDSPSISISATSMDFGSVPIGYISGKQTVSITNKGNSNLNVTVRSCTDGFFVSPDVGSSFTLAPGKTRSDISVNFEPYEERYYSGSVVFTTNDPNHPTISISVMGSGYEEQETNPSIRISEDIIRFDTVSVGSSRTKTIYVTNTGDSDLHVNTVKLLSGDEGFSLSGWGDQNKTISPGESASLSITFSPTVIGDAQDQILIKSDAFNTSHTLVYLYGTGN